MLLLSGLEGSPPVLEEVVAAVDAELVFGDLLSATATCGEFLVHRKLPEPRICVNDGLCPDNCFG
jgi:hypothetical protein